ncbi:MAG: formylmethanofuran dehydrogenase subunit E family protein [Myxococcaceae bacterium]|nr:formylmethanofuran dehydrogenase subunit E family protein [Myxococcaceae bacterium]
MVACTLLLVLSQHGHAAPPAAKPSPDAQLAAVAAVHGEAGPWAVAGYRMGTYALGKLGLAAQSHDLRVVHRSPRTPQFACVADGAQAATGASVGKLNLALEEAPFEQLATTFTNAKTGASVTLKPSKAFVARFTNTPREKAAENGRLVLSLKDADVFEVTSDGAGK